jgi:hypothetical protein
LDTFGPPDGSMFGCSGPRRDDRSCEQVGGEVGRCGGRTAEGEPDS